MSFDLMLSLRKVLTPLLVAGLTIGTLAAHATHATQIDEVNLYTTREPKLIQPILDVFSADTGIKVNTVFIKDGLIERVKAEGEKSPADVLMTVDVGNLIDLVNHGISQPINSTVLNSAVPANLRGPEGNWYALSLRDRVAYVAKELDVESLTYEELADPKWRGKVCIRSGQHPYNTALFAAMIAHNGEQQTQQWLEGVKANLARKATGGDRNVARDILGAICDIGLANAYYVGQMRTAPEGSDNRAWGDAIKVVRPTFAKSGGTFVNITGAAVAKSSPNRDNAIKLIEFLVSDKAQQMYADANFEMPVKQGVKPNAIIEGFGPLTVDTLPISEVAKYRKQASQLVDKVGFNN